MKVRTATGDDADAMAAIYGPIVLQTSISFEWVPPTAAEFRARIAKTSTRYPWLVAVDASDTVAGYVHASPHRDPPSYQWSVNTSVYVRDDARSQGIGKRLYGELLRQLVTLGYYRAFAGIALPNDASVALHESVGFKLVGIYEQVGFKFGQWRDVAWFQNGLQAPSTGEPATPRTPPA